MAKNRAAIYIRVSTDAQREEGYSIDVQKEMMYPKSIRRQRRRISFRNDKFKEFQKNEIVK